MSGADPYAHAIRQAAHDAVRVLVSAEAGSTEGFVALRDVVSWLDRCHGSDALRDLAEELASELADALEVLAAAKGLPAPEMLHSWFRDEQRPPRAGAVRVATAELPLVGSPVLAQPRPLARLRPRSRWW